MLNKCRKMRHTLIKRVFGTPMLHSLKENHFMSTSSQNGLKKSSMRKLNAPLSWKLTVVSAGEDENANTVLLDTSKAGYLFNCGEMTQRCILNNHSAKRFNLINHIFLTSTLYRNIGGIIGCCLSTRWRGKDKPFIIHGHRNNENVFKLLQLFTEIRILEVLKAEWRTPNHKYFEDDLVHVEYVKILPKSASEEDISSNQDNILSLTEEQEEVNYAVAYIVRIKTGADNGKTKSITTYSQSVVNQGTINADQAKDLSLGTEGKFLVLECPSEDYLDSLLASEKLSTLTTDQERMPSLIVHMSPASVIEDKRYKEFMSRFDLTTHHLMLNKNSPCGYVKTQHQLQKVLHRLHPVTFPALQSHAEFGAQPVIPAGNIVQGVPGLQFLPRYRPPFSVSRGLYDSSNAEDKVIRVSPSVLDHLQESLHKGDDYPEVVFLGTSSGSTNWARNPSAILVQTRKDEYILLDCGEGTMHQLYQMYGHQAENVLSNLKAVFLSHLHYDHVGGLPSLIEARARAKSSLENRDKLCIVAPKIFLRWVSNYERYFGELSSKLKVYPHEKIRFDIRVGGEDRQIQQLKQSLGLTQITPVSVIHTETAYGTVLVHEDGWKLVYSGDCSPTPDLIKHGKGCDILIHEGTYPDNQTQRATSTKHSTIKEAMEVAREMGSKFTIITHLSSPQPVQEAKYFDRPDYAHIAFAYDFMKVRRSSRTNMPHIKRAILQAFSTK